MRNLKLNKMKKIKEDVTYCHYSDLPSPMAYDKKLTEESKEKSMNKLDKDYQALLQDILDNGHRKGDRTGTGTISVFGRQIRHNMKDGFPLITTKKMYTKGIITELLWFLRGETNIKSLVDNDCNIWNGDAFKKYNTTYKGNFPLDMEEFVQAIKTSEEFAETYGELGPVYGKQWRNWEGNGSPLTKDYEGNISSYLVKSIDQIQNAINDLKNNPDSRRIIVSAWNVAEIDQMTLPPCHNFFQFYTRELSLKERLNLASTIIGEEKIRTHEDNLERVDKLNIPTRAISLMWNQRSVDTFLGLPFNIASYGLLLEIVGKMVNMIPEDLIGNLGDTHLYSNHIEQAKEQIGREPYKLPKLGFNKSSSFFNELGNDLSLLSHLDTSDFMVENYESHPTIKAPLSN
jgi:thymidylate synthase